MKRYTPALSLLLVLALQAAALACPMCKDAIPNSDAQAPGSRPGGFNTSIYYMLGGVFTVFATGAVFVVKTIRQTDGTATRRGFDVARKA